MVEGVARKLTGDAVLVFLTSVFGTVVFVAANDVRGRSVRG